jgi:hypothetical protein
MTVAIGRYCHLTSSWKFAHIFMLLKKVPLAFVIDDAQAIAMLTRTRKKP